MKFGRILLALLLPPVGVFLTFGFGPTLIINILLTLLGWLPGSIHALWAVVKHEEKIAKANEQQSTI
ncbi:YqaE/Pmp3 family membrane protein [Kovacikia minuta CCNUW1]|uniref:YqaE/Pmp3 family membrane protein n=1 Tax=Kovacikia minuta TaxID=2931930 RepID=UPI001CCDA3BD|nr:YqaE/Pmp3 family membrane protein [Kovacikia minuta]UBF24620.1 YqaE/Pmp3 family membrane protein [Kovacikia minuta CCNUW1]